MIKTVTKEHVIHRMSAHNAPVLSVRPGDCVCLETYDCFKGQLLPEGTTFADYDRKLGNPATGPVYVEGAMPGDALRITVEQIELDAVGILDIGKTSGAFQGYYQGAEGCIRRLHIKDGCIDYNERWQIPVRPMIGVIGTAPAPETGAVGTLSPMDHGGNMDCIKVEQGCVLYLPVFVEGGLLAAGDLHAIMGDGEVGNCGVEIGGKVVLTVDVVPAAEAFPWPVIENDTQWITVAYGEDLDEASKKAVGQMFEFLTRKYVLSDVDAGMLMDMVGDLRICQIVNPYKTVRMEIPKCYLERNISSGYACN